MKRTLNLLFIFALLSVVCCAQNSKPLKGKFYKEELIDGLEKAATITAQFDLYEPTFDGPPERVWNDKTYQYEYKENGAPTKVYGYIEVYDGMSSQFFYIVDAWLDLAPENPEPCIIVRGDMWPAGEEDVRVAIKFDPTNNTITLTDWETIQYFNNDILKRQ